MSIKGKYKNIIIITIISVLTISVSLNVYFFLGREKYKKISNKFSYEYIEVIKTRNENINLLLKNTLQTKSLNKEELLSLYNNYGEMANAEVKLWEHYLETAKRDIFISKSKVAKELGDKYLLVFIDIKELMQTYLNEEIYSKLDDIELKGNIDRDLTTLFDLSNEIVQYFDSFAEDNSDGQGNLSKKENDIGNKYWKDMIVGIEEITNKYNDYEFVYK